MGHFSNFFGAGIQAGHHPIDFVALGGEIDLHCGKNQFYLDAND